MKTLKTTLMALMALTLCAHAGNYDRSYEIAQQLDDRLYDIQQQYEDFGLQQQLNDITARLNTLEGMYDGD